MLSVVYAPFPLGLCDGDRDQLRTAMERYSGSSDVQALALRLLSNQELQLGNGNVWE